MCLAVAVALTFLSSAMQRQPPKTALPSLIILTFTTGGCAEQCDAYGRIDRLPVSDLRQQAGSPCPRPKGRASRAWITTTAFCAGFNTVIMATQQPRPGWKPPYGSAACTGCRQQHHPSHLQNSCLGPGRWRVLEAPIAVNLNPGLTTVYCFPYNMSQT